MAMCAPGAHSHAAQHRTCSQGRLIADRPSSPKSVSAQHDGLIITLRAVDLSAAYGQVAIQISDADASYGHEAAAGRRA